MRFMCEVKQYITLPTAAAAATIANYYYYY